jgi:hypothetical protein
MSAPETILLLSCIALWCENLGLRSEANEFFDLGFAFRAIGAGVFIASWGYAIWSLAL